MLSTRSQTQQANEGWTGRVTRFLPVDNPHFNLGEMFSEWPRYIAVERISGGGAVVTGAIHRYLYFLLIDPDNRNATTM